MIFNLIQRPLIAVSILLLATVIIYRQAPQGEFLWDDEFHIADNKYIQNTQYLPKIFSSDLGEGAGVKYYFYRPMQTLSYVFEFKLWGFNPAGYHVTNILLHALTAVLVFFCIQLLFKDGLLAIFSALLFALHPAHTEAVAYISGRSDILGCLFLLLAFICYIKSDIHTGWRWIGGSSAAFILALLSRETSLILIVMIGLYYFSMKKPIQWRHLAWILGIAVGYVFIRTILLSHFIKPWPALGMADRLLLIPAGYFQFLKIFFWPFHLHMEYAMPVLSWHSKEVLIGTGLLAMTGAIIYKYRKNTIMIFALGWFVVGFLPVSNFYPLNAYFAEHWLYLPSIGLCLLLAYMIRPTVHSSPKNIGVIFLLVVLMFWSIRSFQQVNYWRDSVVFYQRTIQYNPQSDRLFYNLGNLYFKRGYPADKIIQQYQKAIELKSDEADYHYNLALVYLTLRDMDQAEKTLRRVLELDPKYLKAYEDLAILLTNQNHPEEAKRMLQIADQIRVNKSDGK